MSMLPAKRNKVDINVRIFGSCQSAYLHARILKADCVVWMQSLSEEEQKLFRLYGRLPSHKNLLHNQLKVLPELLLLCPAGPPFLTWPPPYHL